MIEPWMTTLFNGGLVLIQGVFVFFLKRILSQLDIASADIVAMRLELARDFVRKVEIEEVKKQLSDVRHSIIGIKATLMAKGYLREPK